MHKLFLSVILITLMLSGCKDDKPLPPPPTVTYSYEIVFREYNKWVCINEVYLKDANGNSIEPIEVTCNHKYPHQCAYLFDGKTSFPVSKGTSLFVNVKTNKPVALVDGDYWVSDTCAVEPSITIR